MGWGWAPYLFLMYLFSNYIVVRSSCVYIHFTSISVDADNGAKHSNAQTTILLNARVYHFIDLNRLHKT